MVMMNKIIIKHMMTRAKDLMIEHDFNLEKKTLELKSDFISPWLLVSFLSQMHWHDERLSDLGIEGAIEFTDNFATTLVVEGVKYKLRCYEASAVTNKPTVEIELFPIKEGK
jgi:hypothetical protein